MPATPRRPAAAAVALTALLAALALLTTAPAQAERHHHRGAPTAASERVLGAQPVLSYRGAADPTTLRYPGGYVSISTGPGAPRAVAPTPGGPWTNIPSALLTLPSWAIAGRAWASDLDYVNGVYLLYFSVEAAGLPTDGRCIGVATATDPTQAFVPQERPVVCPKGALAPKAYDPLKRKDRALPFNGVIDPDFFTDSDGKNYLLYRTEGTPSSIRIVRMPTDGIPGGKTVRSTELVRSDGVIENPSLIKKRGQYVLFASEGSFTDCTYATTWRRSPDLMDWSGARAKDLLDSYKTGLCGPGGADVSVSPTGHPLLFFHAWTCPQLGGNCPQGPNYDTTALYGAQRSMFAMAIKWTKHQRPLIAGYVAPVPAPTPPAARPARRSARR